MSEIQEIQGGFDAPPAKGGAPAAAPGAGADSMALPSFNRAAGGGAAGGPIELLKDVDLNVKIELGRTRMLIEDVLRLGEGSVVELDKLAGDPVDVFVNDQLVARGEVLVLNDNFCVRINEIITAAEE
ncbi:MAG TPA: flagellar motor switch protein FliN [Phycisphaerae bacterium]|jgi:flagellar motor switch protein FliN/FliY|nr:flagellar motor switch protein FliN [Phycisphaerae bacterium]